MIVLHVPSDSTGIFNTVAAASASLPVHAAKDGMMLERGHIYLGVPNFHLIAQDGMLRLGSAQSDPARIPAWQRFKCAAENACVIHDVLSERWREMPMSNQECTAGGIG